jgi:hypothetical protein
MANALLAGRNTSRPADTAPASPPLARRHIAQNARLFANREDMLASMHTARHGIVAEIGVAAGDFSAFILDALAPERFVGFDIFTMHETPIIWGKPSSELFDGMTQLEFYRRRFRNLPQVVIEQGPSQIMLATYPDASFDLIYVDGDHRYDGVKQDAQLAARKIKQDGVIIFNDYVMQDLVGARYGVVQAVNELVTAGAWSVIGFAFQREMFCDIAIQRARS